jgi:FkbM family methyltransferase
MPGLGHYIGERLYWSAFPVYRVIYRGYKNFCDRPERALLTEHLHLGDVVVDAGANIGVYSEFLSSLVGPHGTVHSFEPSPQNFARLKAATATLSNIHVNEMAVGSETRESLLYLSRSLNVDHRSYAPAGPARETISIKTMGLDDYFQENRTVNFIKLDIQGHELQALLGARRIITQNPGMKLLLEFWPHGLLNAGAQPREVPDLLIGFNFKLFTVEKTGLVPFDFRLADNHDVDFYRNIFAMRDST